MFYSFWTYHYFMMCASLLLTCILYFCSCDRSESAHQPLNSTSYIKYLPPRDCYRTKGSFSKPFDILSYYLSYEESSRIDSSQHETSTMHNIICTHYVQDDVAKSSYLMILITMVMQLMPREFCVTFIDLYIHFIVCIIYIIMLSWLICSTYLDKLLLLHFLRRLMLSCHLRIKHDLKTCPC